MEKKTRKIITIGGAVLLALSLTTNVVLGVISANPKGLSGSVNETWRMNESRITSYLKDTWHYYSFNADYIYNVYVTYTDDYVYTIEYDTYFNLFDDLEVYFVFKNYEYQTVSTPVETTHWPTGDSMEVDLKTYDDFILKGVRITEVWVRTVD